MLRTVEAIVDALGGNTAVVALTGVGSNTVSMWKARGWIPAEYFLTLSAALAKLNKRADSGVFNFKAPAKVRA